MNTWFVAAQSQRSLDTRSGAGVGDTEVAQCEAGKPTVVKVKHESWQAGSELLADLVGFKWLFQRNFDMVLVGSFRDGLQTALKKRLERKRRDVRSRPE